MKLSERLAEPIIAEAFGQGAIMSSKLSERLIRERAEAADLLDECEKALEEAMDWMHTDWDETDGTCIRVEATLARLKKEYGR